MQHSFSPRHIELNFTGYLQEVLDHFSACFGIRTAFYDTLRRELKVGMRQGCCRFCRLVRESLDLSDACLACDVAGADRANVEQRLVRYHCHAGMLEMIKPVYMGHLLIGYVMIGQFRDREEPDMDLRQLWRRRFGDDAALCAAFREAPCFTPARLVHIVGIFEALVESTMDRRAYQLAEEEPGFRLKSFLMRHIARNVSQEEAAKHLGWSLSTLSHRIRLQTGFSFKQLQIAIKLDFAEKLMRECGRNVAEAGAAVGFRDPAYFSRLYRRHRGIPPSQCRRDPAAGPERAETAPLG